MIGDPSMELAMSVLNPDGSVNTRWGSDEQAVADIPRGLTFSTSDPGGFKDCQVGLERDLNISWPDLGILKPLEIYGQGGLTAWEGRTQELPARAGDEVSINPGGVGHAARLEDDPSFAEIYIDRDLSGWGPPSLARSAALAAASFATGQVNAYVGYADSTGGPGLYIDFQNVAKAAGAPFPGYEFWYYGGGVDIGRVWFDQKGDASTGWNKFCLLSTDDLISAHEDSASFNGVTESLQQPAPLAAQAAAGKKYALFQTFFATGGPFTMGNIEQWRNVIVVGRHGLALRGAWPSVGIYGSDAIADIVSRAAPDLKYSTGADGSIQPSSFPIPHLAFKEGVKAADAVLAINAYHQRSWGVYENKEFFWRPATSYRKRWRIRRSLGHQVELLGPQADDAINGVVVTFTDAGGVQRVIGPPGCATAYTTSAALADTSSNNPVNEAGIERKWAELKLQFVTTVAGALEVGIAYLNEKLLSGAARGSVTVAGLVEDDETGVLYPSWYMRAGDAAVVADGDGIARGIIETSYSHDERSCTCNFDTTPHKVEALMERMGIVLVGLVE